MNILTLRLIKCGLHGLEVGRTMLPHQLGVLTLALLTLSMGCQKKEATLGASRAGKSLETVKDTMQSGLQLAARQNSETEQKFKTAPTLKGATIDVDRAAELELKLRNDPEDVAARRELLTTYSRLQYRSEAARRSRQEHILWLIENHPETDIDGPYLTLNRTLDGTAIYDRAAALWLEQVQKHPESLTILDHAASFLLQEKRKTAEELWKKAQLTEPDNPTWAERLAGLYSLNSNSGGPEGSSNAVQALEQMERAQTSTPGDFEKLDNLAKMAFQAGQMEKAVVYARDLLSQAPAHRKAWNYGNAIHRGNLVLGRVALREGRLDEAKQYLLEAGKTPGSPQLNSFGPNMSLAKDLLEKGEKETVLAYLKLCESFWKMGGAKLAQWSKDVSVGAMPDFGANLVF